MSWSGIDAIDGAIKRTKKALLEPFNFWKWIKLGIIIFFLGGGGSSFNPGSFNQPYRGAKTPAPTMDEILSQITQFWHEYFTIILVVAAFFVFLILLFGYISSIMEFVLVESLVTDVVTFWASSRKYLRLGFNLFIIKLVIGLFFLSLFILFMLPVFKSMTGSAGAILPVMILGLILKFIAVLLGIAIVNGIIQSFISLSIPLAMYNDMGIIEGFKSVVGKARADWKQIGMYWIIRILLGIAVGIALGIVAFILILILFVILAIPAVVLYYILSGIGAQILFWILMALYGLFAFIVFFGFILIVSVPVPVFMKYHMLTFLKMWYEDARIPFVDVGGHGEQAP
ncbi:MAG: hypothetical protein OIN89_02950 [Candidatus Methanoperedens sp.]|jgi:hypothetical protein|nr:hypothetical protein [Candidatus Methanoperedens sp.]PKL54244.1 MAG: hypothetical protein CVV36_02890 [Candidatus Methanoperedenaceae archaeon HGW-Methanoperedenaceae-1]